MNRERDSQLTVTIATRFDRETAEVLREAARERGIGVTTLIRMWTLDRLRRLSKNNKHEANLSSPPLSRPSRR
jgi:hypothetical protein